MNEDAFSTALLDPARPVPSGLVGPGARPAGRRFDIYRNNVVAGLTDALRNYFPVLAALVGDTFFTAMAAEFVRGHLPTSPILFRYGSAMPAFLEGFAPVAHLPYLPDVARLELAIKDSYHAADTVPVAPVALASLTPDALAASRLRLAPHLRLVRSTWPIHAIWSANTRGTPPPDQRIPEDALVLRPALDPVVLLVPRAGATFLAAIAAGQPLVAAVDAAGGDLDLAAMLGLLLSHGGIAAICPETTE